MPSTPRLSDTVTVRPIVTKADYQAALDRAWQLMNAGDGPEGAELDVLATLIEAYEAKHFPTDLPDAIEAIKFRMEEQGLTRKDLEPAIGSRARVSEVMNRKRGLSATMIRNLNKKLGISVEVLIQPTTPFGDKASFAYVAKMRRPEKAPRKQRRSKT
jgi:HTH-type transcriptional regulator/antitoxin HigA